MNVPSTQKQRRYLIAIGSPTCAAMQGFDELTRVETDVKRIKNCLKEQGYTEELKELETSETSQSIKSAIESWFKSEDRRSSDSVVIYYAGHGGDENGDHYLYTVESKRERLATTAIKTSDLIDLLFPANNNSPENILLILDVCHAGQGAKQGLANRLIRSMRSGKKVTFGVITSADSDTLAGDGDFVDAFETTMKDITWMSECKSEFLEIGELVERINQLLQKKSNGQEAYVDFTDLSGKQTFFRNPCYSGSTQRKSQEQIIANCLFSLDYCHQEKVFKEIMEKQKAIAFLIQADESKIQSWLVGRLARLVSDFNTAKRYPVRLRRHPMLWNFEAFWQEFKNDIKLENERNRETVIKVLAEIYNQRSVIIAIYGLSRLSTEDVKKFYDFWLALVNQVTKQKCSFRSSHLVLLLAEESKKDVVDKLSPFQFGQSSSICEAIHLAPLDRISREDALKWLRKTNVYDSLNLPDDQVQEIVKNFVPKWSEKPLEMLVDICCDLFKIKQEEAEQKTLAEIEPYWKLEG
jgi:hypothetical protein